MRQLKHHEQKLLKKVNFLSWKNEHNQRELQVRLRGVGAGHMITARGLDHHAQHNSTMLGKPPALAEAGRVSEVHDQT